MVARRTVHNLYRCVSVYVISFTVVSEANGTALRLREMTSLALTLRRRFLWICAIIACSSWLEIDVIVGSVSVNAFIKDDQMTKDHITHTLKDRFCCYLLRSWHCRWLRLAHYITYYGDHWRLREVVVRLLWLLTVVSSSTVNHCSRSAHHPGLPVGAERRRGRRDGWRRWGTHSADASVHPPLQQPLQRRRRPPHAAQPHLSAASLLPSGAGSARDAGIHRASLSRRDAVPSRSGPARPRAADSAELACRSGTWWRRPDPRAGQQDRRPALLKGVRPAAGERGGRRGGGQSGLQITTRLRSRGARTVCVQWVSICCRERSVCTLLP